MTEKRRVCTKPILDKIVSGIYKFIGYFIIIILILGISFFSLYPHYQKYTYMEDCKQNGHQKDWCEKTWLELLELE